MKNKRSKTYRELAHFLKHKNYLGFLVFFFLIGILWGKFFYYSEKNRSVLFTTPSLVLLAEEGFLPGDVTESFAIESGLDLKIITYTNKETLISLLKDQKFDLIAFKSYYAQDILNNLSKIAYKNISNKESISVDFKNSPYDPENKFAVPLFWGVEKKENIEKNLLWVESVGVFKNSNMKKEAHEFVDYILQSDVALEVIRLKKVASTNRSIEKAKNIESNLKPSYIRKISISNLKFKDRAGF